MFRNLVFALAAMVMMLTSFAVPASATDLKGVAQIGAIGGVGGSFSLSQSKVEAWKSFGLDQNGTVSARAAGITVFEGSIDNRAGSGHNAIGTGQDATSRLYTGSESFSAASLTGPGAATSQASNVTIGGGAGVAGSGFLKVQN